MPEAPSQSSLTIAGVDPYPSVLFPIAASTGLDADFMDQILYCYLAASATIWLPAPTPGAWVTVQNSTWTATGAYTLTIDGGNLWTGISNALTNGQWVKYTAMDNNGTWKWAAV